MQRKFTMRYFISKSCFRAELCCYTHSLATTFCLKHLRKRKHINNEIWSDSLEQSAITVVISHLNSLKHCVAAKLRHSYRLNQTKLGLDVIVTSFLNHLKSPCYYHHGNTSVQKLPQISTLHLVKWGKSGVGIKMIKSGNFHYFSIKSYVV